VRYLKSQLQEIFGALDSESETLDQDQTEDCEPCAEASCSEESPCASKQELRGEMTEAEPVATRDESADVFSSSETRARTTQRPDVEVERLKNLLAIQERMLDSKDDEIADLKNQRAWLRQRIEKLEEKHDRDQILLLSETQTIRSLIAYQESRKSSFRQLLEWIGIAPSSSYTALPQPHSQQAPSTATTSGRTIEVRQAANHE
jgi:hypothetical protein